VSALAGDDSRLAGIVVEMHPNLWHTAGTSRRQADDLPRSLDLVLVPLSGQREPHADHGMVALERSL
jgi:hypothetical protein